MSLDDYTVPTEVVEFKNGKVTVRGVSSDDLAVLLRSHLPDLENLIEIFSREIRQDIAVAAIVQHAVPIIREAPGLVANVIALACDAPDDVEKVRRMTLGTQVKLLEAIAKLTFEDVGGAGKFVESLFPMMKGLRAGSGPLGLTSSRT